MLLMRWGSMVVRGGMDSVLGSRRMAREKMLKAGR
jgi:hypothetical protein